MTDTRSRRASPAWSSTHRGLEGQPRDQLAALPRLPRAGARGDAAFEEVAYLLWYGELPTESSWRRSRRSSARSARSTRTSSGRSTWCRSTAHPMDVVRTAVSAVRRERPGRRDNCAARRTSPRRSGCSRSCRRSSPTTSAAAAARSSSQPREDLGLLANFLHMTFGEVPDPVVVERVRRLDDPVRRALVQRVDLHRPRRHERRSPTSTRRSSARSARSRVRCTAAPTRPSCTSSTRSARPTTSAPWLDQALAEKRKIMGFGHRVYKHGDSRVPTMKAALDTLVEQYDARDLAALYDDARVGDGLAQGHRAEPRLPVGSGLQPDGVRHPTFTPLFVASRVTGWTAHIMEQAAANALIRPLSAYNGPDERHIEGYVPDAAAEATVARPEEAAG